MFGNEQREFQAVLQNGIDEATANKIYDEMIDFAKYALISPIRSYAVVSIRLHIQNIIILWNL